MSVYLLPVAVSQRVDIWPARNEVRDALDRRLCDFLVAAGLLPLPVPNVPTQVSAWLSHMQPAGIVLSGGNDVGEFPARDDTERQLCAYAAVHGLPLLGLCRGMQFLASEAGAVLVRRPGHVGNRHAVHGEIEAEVNSFHDYALAAVPQGYRALATADDGSIEAIRHHQRAWEGWMWHPERDHDFSTADLQRLRSLFGLNDEVSQ